MDTQDGAPTKMSSSSGSAPPGRDLYAFLVEAELAHYYQAFRTDLKVTSVPQLKYVEDEDLTELGMSRPEVRRLKKFFRRECPQGAFGKIKKILSVKGGEAGILRSGGGGGGGGGGESPGEKSPQHTIRTPSKHIIAADAISVCKTLGTGEFGTVQQGIWTNEDGERVQVAVKKLSKERMQAGTPDFLKEATIMHSIDHDHVVRLYGVVLDSDALMLVTELAPLRSLLECLKEPAMRASFPVAVLCDFAHQVADGMAYLESKRLIHRDLAARNILVFTRDKVKISDFGLSRALGVGKDYYQTNFSVNLKLPIAWCAPECINYLKFTTASDVWAYGVTLWEMFTYGFQPWAAFTGQQILEAIDEPNFQRLEQPDCCPREHFAIMTKCWEHEPRRRPTFADIHRMLPQIKPEQVQMTSESCQGARADFLHYKATEVITVLDKRPEGAPSSSIWKGVLDSGKVGLFDSTDSTPYIEIKAASPLRTRIKMSRRDSSRKSVKSARKLRADMISRPQNDLRHTGHIGYDGAMFGDVAFIGNNYDKLPVKVVSPYKPQDDVVASSSTAGVTLDDIDKANVSNSQSDVSIISTTSTMTGASTSIAPGFSQLSIASSQANSDTFTDVSSYQGDADSLYRANGRASGGYEELDDDNLEDFKMPDISSSFSLDIGTSFMDEVMKAFSDVTDREKTPTEERRPLPGLPDDDRKASHDRTNGTSSLLSSSLPATSSMSAAAGAGYDKYGVGRDYRRRYSGDLDDEREEEVRQNVENAALDSSRSSSSATLGSGSDDTPRERRRSRPKLRIDDDDESIPLWDSKKQEGIRPMSAKEEKTIDDAIAVATEYVQKSVSGQSTPKTPITPKDKSQPHHHQQQQQQPPPPPASPEPDPVPRDGSGSGAPADGRPEKPETLAGLRSVFGLKKRSPRHEGRVFSEELSKSNSVSREDVSPEAQEVYNVLVGQGPKRERPEDGGAAVEHRRHVRDRRVRRSLEHQRNSAELSASVADVGAAKERNQNLREPQGIPGRGAALRDPAAGDVDVNPLRRLRESHSFIPRAARPPSGGDGGDKMANGHHSNSAGSTPPRSTSLDHIRRQPHLPPQSHFRPRIPDPEGAPPPTPPKTSYSADELAVVGGARDGGAYDARNPPIPPRQPLRPANITTKHRERKYPLDLNGSASGSGGGTDSAASSDHLSDSSCSEVSARPSTLPLREELPTDDQTDIDVVDGSTSARSSGHQPVAASDSRAPPVAPKPRPQTKSYSHLPPFAVKNVTCSASEMGIGNEKDAFWAKPVDFESLGDVDSINAPPQEEGLIPIRYKSPDNVSYEDLMEFALDGSGEQNVCDEIRIMRKVLSKDVTVEDCLMALEETKWDVLAAIKYLKLKQLLSTKLGDVEACKAALVRFSWCVPAAADFMVSNPPDQSSPDIVEL